jgi:dimethylhistidine N-methyltransferase
MSDPVAEETAASFHDLEPKRESFREAVLKGLAKPQKEIPCKFFYDERGSRLFEEICRLEEYYLTRTEIGILEANRDEIAELMGPGAELIEFGSGSVQKARIVLDAMEAPAAYVPIDISKAHLLRAAEELARDYPDLKVTAVCADYTQRFSLPEAVSGVNGRKVGFFPGSTIGNFSPTRASAFLEGVAGLLGPSGELLIGVDLKKDREILHAAYNDRRGVTAAFNLNLLRRVNRELEGDFDLAAFRHRAEYNEEHGRVEMHLVSRKAQTVHVARQPLRFGAGETIHTENSYKYEIEEFLGLAEDAGFEQLRTFTDGADLFSVHYLRAA